MCAPFRSGIILSVDVFLLLSWVCFDLFDKFLFADFIWTLCTLYFLAFGNKCNHLGVCGAIVRRRADIFSRYHMESGEDNIIF